MKHGLRCISCGAEFSPDEVVYTCDFCGDLLDVWYDYQSLNPDSLIQGWRMKPFGVWRYRELLPIRSRQVVSLGEGGTKLRRCDRLISWAGAKNLFVKYEGENPTGSFKDRGMTVGVTKALELGAKKVICASTGNTSASLAAYAAKAGVECIVLVPAGKIALGKLAQAIAYGAKVVQVEGNFDEALKLAMDLSKKEGLAYLLNSVNPFRLEGQKTLAYEVFEQLGMRVPDAVVVPVGNAGNISAIWKGFCELARIGLTDETPRMYGVQASGAAPIAHAFKKGLEEVRFVENPETIATAIRIGAPVNWKKAVRAVEESGGWAIDVTDSEIIEAQKSLARMEGMLVEPASAASLAGVRELVQEGYIDRDEEVVCVATGHGLKDPNTIIEWYEKPLQAAANLEEVRKLIE